MSILIHRGGALARNSKATTSARDEANAWSGAIASAFLLALAPNVRAQQASGSSDQQPGAKLEEIIVTASKREETLSKAPLAISALSDDQLRTAGVTGLKDLTSVVPGVTMKTVGIGNSIQVTVRGITNSDFNQLGDPAVATYFDGIYIGRTQGLYGALYDIERVEVLRGPQGTLYGRNATGGNINVITPDPENRLAGALNVAFGSHNDRQVDGMLNVPVGDTLALRGAVVMHTSDGYYDTQGSTARNYGSFDDYGGRLTALWTPSEDFRWRLTFEDFSAQGTPSISFRTALDGKPADGLPVFDRPMPNSPDPATDIHNFMARSRMDWGLSESILLSYIAGYQDLDYVTQFAVADASGAGFDGSRNNESRSYSHELNLSYDAGRLQNILGASYFKLENSNRDGYHLRNVGLTFGAYDALVATKAWGVFDQLTFSLTDALKLIGGVRYSREEKFNFGDEQAFCPISAYPDLSLPDILALFEGPGCFHASQGSQSGEWSNVDWKAALSYDLSDSVSTYLSVTTGFKSGGLNPGVNVFGNKDFDPETVTSYELGIKGRFLEDTLSLNTAIFYMDYEELQVTQINEVEQITDNAGGAGIYGIEIEGQWRITQSDLLAGFLSGLDATYTEYRNAVDQRDGSVYPSLDGNYLPHAPKLSARLQYSHDFTLGNGATITPMAAVYWQSESYLRGFNFLIDRIGSYSKTSLNLTYQDTSGHWRAALYVDNLEDEVVRNNGYTAIGNYFSDYAPPRTFGARISYEY